jgi:hypothetical protein
MKLEKPTSLCPISDSLWVVRRLDLGDDWQEAGIVYGVSHGREA